MQSELPWNVAGIPSEAREAARAAARREGLSVGEWMTRRILRGFPDATTDSNDNWRQPVEFAAAPLASPRESEEMLARVSRSEAESQNAYKGIDQQLKAVAHRLETAERNQSENSRAMTQAATQISVAAREQAQAFDQMNANVSSLAERLIRLERRAQTDGMKDAVKALHLGLSRVADQIASTASQSASQIAALAGNVDSLATQVVAANEKVDVTALAVEAHLAALDERIRLVERTSCSSASALDHTMENVERLRADKEAAEGKLRQHIAAVSQMKDGIDDLSARVAAGDSQHIAVISQMKSSLEDLSGRVAAGDSKHNTALSQMKDGLDDLSARVAGDSQHIAAISQMKDSLADLNARVAAGDSEHARLQDSVTQLEAASAANPLDRRLAGIEHVLTDIMNRIEQTEQSSVSTGNTVEQTLRDLANGFEIADQRHRETIRELQSTVNDTANKIAAVEEKLSASQPSAAAPPPTTVQINPEPAPALTKVGELVLDAPPFADEIEPEHHPDLPPLASDFAMHLEHPDLPGHLEPLELEHVDGELPPFPSEAASPPADLDAPAPQAENESDGAPESFLAAARRSAKTAAAERESASTQRSAMGWTLPGRTSVSTQSENRGKRYALAGSIFGVAVVAALTGVVLSHGVGSTQPHTFSNVQAIHRTMNAPAASKNAGFLPHAGVPATTGSVSAPAKSAAETHAPLIPVQQPNAAKGASPAPVAADSPTEKLASLANTGDSRAQLLLGLKYLEGSGMTVNEAEAARWLSRAAQQGEALAQYRLATLYERGRGVPVSAKEATHWYELAAKQGNRKAMHNLAIAYAEGSGETKDAMQAAMWFTRAANLGLADSQFNLAVLYERGMGVKQNLVDAYKWYLIAAAQGDSESKTRSEALSTQLSDTDRAAAQQSAASFRPQPLMPAANSVASFG